MLSNTSHVILLHIKSLRRAQGLQKVLEKRRWKGVIFKDFAYACLVSQLHEYTGPKKLP